MTTTPSTGSSDIDLDKLMLDKNERSIFEREAMHWLDGTHPLITGAEFRLNDDGTYWSSATRRLFGFWQAARRATHTSGSEDKRASLSEEHPNLKVPIDPACSAKLDELGDDRGQGLDPYWKFGFRTGWHHARAALTSRATTAEQQPAATTASASISDDSQFRILLDNWSGAAHSCDERTRTVYAKQAYNALIAHIDSRATAPSRDKDELPKVSWLDAPHDIANEHASTWAKGWNAARAAMSAPATSKGSEG